LPGRRVGERASEILSGIQFDFKKYIMRSRREEDLGYSSVSSEKRKRTARRPLKKASLKGGLCRKKAKT